MRYVVGRKYELVKSGSLVLNFLDNEKVLGYILLAPLLTWLLVVLIYPLFSTVHLSFFSQRLAVPIANYIGLGNYSKLITDVAFWQALQVSLIWSVANVILQVSLGLAVAVLLNQKFYGVKILKGSLLMPWALPAIVISVIGRWVFHSIGVVNYIAGSLGRGNIDFFSVSNALKTLIVMFSWRQFPFIALMLFASLQAIPIQELEAALVDGANHWQRFWKITFPHMVPTIKIISILSFFWAFNQFALIWLTTQGGPVEITTTLPVKVYSTAFRSMRLGEGAAFSVLMFIFLSVFLVAYFNITNMLERE